MRSCAGTASTRFAALAIFPFPLSTFGPRPGRKAAFPTKKQKTTPDTAREALTAILAVLEPLQAWNKDVIFEACRAKAEAMEKKNGWLMYPLGIALAGQRSTPGGGTDLAAMLGKEKTLQRIRLALEKLG